MKKYYHLVDNGLTYCIYPLGERSCFDEASDFADKQAKELALTSIWIIDENCLDGMIDSLIMMGKIEPQ